MFQPAAPGDPAALPESEVMTSTWKTDSDPALKAFAIWVDQYLAAGLEEGDKLEPEGIKLAKARRDVIKKQIQADPRRALANAVPIAIRKQLPEAVVKYLEKRLDGFADWGTSCEMMTQGGSQEEDFALLGGQKFTAFRYGKSKEGARFVEGGSLHGIAIDGDLAVLDSPLRALEPGEVPSGKEVAEAVDFAQSDTIAQKRDAVRAGQQAQAAARFNSRSSDEASPFSQPATSQVFAKTGMVVLPQLQGNGSQAGARYYQIGGSVLGKATNEAQAERAASVISFRQNSYRNVQEALRSDDGWVVNPEPQYLTESGSPGSSGVPDRPPVSHTSGNKKVLIMRAQTTARPLDSSVTNNTTLVNAETDINNRYGYMSSNGLSITFSNTSVYNLPSSFDTQFRDNWHNECKTRAQSDGFNLANYDVLVTITNDTVSPGYGGVAFGSNIIMNNSMNAYAFVHEFGHWLSLPHARLFTSTDGNPMSPSRGVVDYGDDACYMAATYNGYNQNIFNPIYQSKLRWLSDGDVQTVGRSGTFRIYQYDPNVTGRTRAIKIGRDDSFNYWLSIRGNADSSLTNFVNGLSIRTHDWNGSQSTLVDMHPNDGGAGNAPLQLNEEWNDSAADLKIKVTGVGGGNPNRYVDVQITFGPLHNAAFRPLVNGGIYRFSSRHNSAISLSGNTNTAAGQPIVMANNNDADTKQQFIAQRNADGSYSFKMVSNGQFIDVAGNQYANGTEICQFTGGGGDNQKFYVKQNPDGFIVFARKNAEGSVGYTLDLNTSNNDIAQYSINYGNNQQWKPELIGITYGQNYRVLPNHAQGQTLEVAGSVPGNGAKGEIWSWNGGTNQIWNIDSTSGGVRFKSATNNAKVLDIDGGTQRSQLWDDLGGTNQRFSLVRTGGHWVRIVPAFNSGLSLDVNGPSSANGTNVSVFTNNGGSNQKWRFADTDN